MPGRMLMMARKKAPVSSQDSPDSAEGPHNAPDDSAGQPHDDNVTETGDEEKDLTMCPNCHCVFNNETGEIMNEGDYDVAGADMDVGQPKPGQEDATDAPHLSEQLATKNA